MSKNNKDIVLRSNYNKNEKFYIINKFLNSRLGTIRSSVLSNKSFFNTFLKSKKSRIKITNFCIITKKSKVKSKLLGLSRHQFRKYALFGLIPGYSKSVW